MPMQISLYFQKENDNKSHSMLFIIAFSASSDIFATESANLLSRLIPN